MPSPSGPPAALPPSPFWTILGLLLGVLLFDGLGRSQSAFSAESVGLGRGTVPFTAEHRERQVSGPFQDLPAVKQAFRELRAEGHRIALWIGASQLYAINQPLPGDQLAVWHASERAAERGSDLAYVMSASPNANPNELYAALLSFLQDGLVPDVLVLGFTFDDLKETGLRAKALSQLRPPSADELRLGGPSAAHLAAALAPQAEAQEPTAALERSPTAGTPQEQLEDFLVAHLEAAWPAYAARGDLRSAAIAAWKVPLTAGIYAVLRRPTIQVPPHTARWNEDGLTSILAHAGALDVPIFVYKAPYRPDPRAFHHDRKAYDAFHAELEQRLARAGARWRDLETLVPTEYWGRTNDGSPDVFHYRSEGHQRLGTAIDAWLEEEDF